MAWLRFCLLATLALAATGSSDDAEENQCFPTIEFPTANTIDSWTSTTKLMIYRQLKSQCSGQIAGWHFYAQRAGNFFASTWRRYQGVWYLRSKARIYVEEEGEHTVILPTYQRTRLRIGDAIGVFYDAGEESVIPHTLDVDGLGLQTVTQIAYFGENPGDIDDSDDLSARCALEPIWNEEVVRLVGSDNPSEGRAEFYRNGAWGSVCAADLELEGWPQTFCRELGYDRAVDVEHVINGDVTMGHGDVTISNPVCTADDLFMSYCGTTGETCEHTSDVYIKCGSTTTIIPTGTVQPIDHKTGIIVFNNGGVTAPVCADDVDLTNGKAPWADTMCWQAGYDHAVTDSAYSGSASPTFWVVSSECNTKDSVTLDKCVELSEKSCTSFYHVTCEYGVRMVDGAYENEGRAEHYDGSNWGTICDIEYTTDNWPVVFCLEMGYDTALDATMASQSVSGVGSGAITLMNPICQDFSAMDMARCWKRGDTCTHSDDVYVTCDYTNMCDESNICKNGGTCTPTYHDYYCTCQPGYVGYNCELNEDDCAENPCHNGGACNDGIDSYTCSCPTHYTGDNCEMVDIPEQPGIIMCYGLPDYGIEMSSTLIVSDMPTVFRIDHCQNGMVGVTLEVVDHPGMHIVYRNGVLSTDSCSEGESCWTSFSEDTCFSVESGGPEGTARFYSAAATSTMYLTWDLTDHSLGVSGEDLPQQQLFYFIDLDSSNSFVAYEDADYEGRTATLTNEENDMRAYLSGYIGSIVITGRHSWQLYEGVDFQGSMATLSPGRYNIDWLQSHGFMNNVNSVRPVGAYDSLILFNGAGYSGETVTIRYNQGDLRASHMWMNTSSLIVVGPEPWEVFEEASYSGHSLVVEPGKYDFEWVTENLPWEILSARKNDNYTHFCGVDGMQDIEGISGAVHRVNLVNRGGSIWIQLGQEDLGASWNQVNSLNSREFSIFSDEDIAILKDLNILDFEVESDLTLLSQASSNSWHPSTIEVMYLGSRATEEWSFSSNPNLDTHLTFSSDHMHIRCGSAYSTNLCGDSSTNFPERNDNSDSLLVTQFNMDPQGVGAYADGQWSRNAYTWSGSKYLLFARLASCMDERDSGIPLFVFNDIWTRTPTGCVCEFDTNSTLCACCHEGGCACGEDQQYQCVRCGYQESHCGFPSIVDGVYTLEESDLSVDDHGDHFILPETCITQCTMHVDARSATATEVVAHMSDWSSRRRLSCSIYTDSNEDPNAVVEAYADSYNGVPVSSINFFGFNGVGIVQSLELITNSTGCSEYRDSRYVACFHYPTESAELVMQEASLMSTHMTVETCISHCRQQNYLFAGLRAGTTCTCGTELPGEGVAYDCSYTCSGDSDETCGGLHSLTIYRTEGSLDGGYFVAPSCSDLSVAHVGEVRLSMDPEGCAELTGQNTEDCLFEMCHASRVITGGLYISESSTCGDRFRQIILINTTGADCANMGGSAGAREDEWGVCKMDLCEGAQDVDVLVAKVRGTCRSGSWRGYVELDTPDETCRQIGGAMNSWENDNETLEHVSCHVDLCRFDTSSDDNSTYVFPNEDVQIPTDAIVIYNIEEMCASSVEIFVEAPATVSSVQVQFMYDNEEVGLYAEASASGSGSVGNSLRYADPAMGVMVNKVMITAHNDTGILRWMHITLSPNGCVEGDVAIVLYEFEQYMGLPRIIHEDSVADLEEFNNEASSVKVHGASLWQVFEYRDFGGRSIVLSEGGYPDMALIPFGNDEMSSLKKTTSIDVPREDISDADGIVCFQTITDMSYVFGTISAPRTDDRPRTFYFGEFGGFAYKCEQACRAEPECVAWTQHLDNYGDSEMAGGCYGRSFHYDDISVPEEEVVSGMVSNCALEDTITVFEETSFAGGYLTIIENVRNLTTEYNSAIITGSDYWRLTFHTETEIHNFWLPAGEYDDLSMFVENATLVEVVKQHPGILYYGNASIDMSILYPIIEIEVITEYGEDTQTEYCNTTMIAEVGFVIDNSNSITAENYELVRLFVQNISNSFNVGPDDVRVGIVQYSSSYLVSTYMHLDDFTTSSALNQAIVAMPYTGGSTYTHLGLDLALSDVLNVTLCRENVPRVSIVITDGMSIEPEYTATSAHALRDDGVNIVSIGVGSAAYDELVAIAGDQSRVFNVTHFGQLAELANAISETTCHIVEQQGEIKNHTIYRAITIPGDDAHYFEEDHWDFVRKPYPLGMESGIILDAQIFAHSSLILYPAHYARLRGVAGWISANTEQGSWIQADFGKILPVHGVSSQGHAVLEAWVTAYKIAISIDAINFVTLKDTNSTHDLIFEANDDQHTIRYHCLHRIFGEVIRTRVVRILIVHWHLQIGLRFEMYGFRDYDDERVIDVLKTDVWTRNVTGCPCYFNPYDKSCACCEDGGCQCSSSNRHQCVQCGYPHNCGTPSIRHMEYNVDGWTSSLSGCRCVFDPLRTDCACCQNYGCQCGTHNRNQCINCGHPEHCGLKEWLFGPNEYCIPRTCPASNQDMIMDGMEDA